VLGNTQVLSKLYYEVTSGTNKKWYFKTGDHMARFN